MTLCVCQSGRHYADCCAPWHQGQMADTVEQLMRSRFSAFVLGLKDYLHRTWHSQTRPEEVNCDSGLVWAGLEIQSSSQSGDCGQVTFRATCVQFYPDEAGIPGEWHELKEVSQFVREQGQWLYTEGDSLWQPLVAGRNETCPCGSGSKFKKCCLTENSAFFRRARQSFEHHAPGHGQ